MTDDSKTKTVEDAESAYPPVEPPKIGVLIQLFVIPAIIVSIVVGVYFLFSQLANLNTNPEDYVDRIQRGNAGSWQAANALASQLRNAGNDEIRKNIELNTKLAALLEAEIKEGSNEPTKLTLRYYLCRCLGQFSIENGLPAILSAVQTARNPDEHFVRKGAIEGIATLASNLDPQGEFMNQEVIDVLIEASMPVAVKNGGEQNTDIVRSASAFAMGEVKDPSGRLEKRLEEMVNDSYPDARLNAATALAKLGNEKCLPTIELMLQPDQLKEAIELNVSNAKNQTEKSKESERSNKEYTILINGMRSVVILQEKYPEIDISSTYPLLEKLQKDHDLLSVTTAAKKTLQKLKEGEKSQSKSEPQSENK